MHYFSKFYTFLWPWLFFWKIHVCRNPREVLKAASTVLCYWPLHSFSKIATGGVLNLIIKNTAIPIVLSVENTYLFFFQHYSPVHLGAGFQTRFDFLNFLKCVGIGLSWPLLFTFYLYKSLFGLHGYRGRHAISLKP